MKILAIEEGCWSVTKAKLIIYFSSLLLLQSGKVPNMVQQTNT
jgi:hypothetical protein